MADDPNTIVDDPAPAPEPKADPAPEPKADPDSAPEPKADPAPTLADDPDPKVDPKVQPDWPDDWREKLSGDDKKTKDLLSKLDSPTAVVRKLMEQEKKISQGIKPLERPGADASDEEWAKYRKQAGLPEDAKGYIEAIELSDGRSIGKEDMPFVEKFAETMHQRGAPVGDLTALIETYYGMEEGVANENAEAEEDFKNKTSQELQQEYGASLKNNLNAIRPYISSMNEGLYDTMLGARVPNPDDPTKTIRLGNHPDFIKFMIGKALDENPAVTVVPAGGNQVQAIKKEIEEIRMTMKTDPNAYWKDQAKQDRLKELLAADEKLSQKGAG